ncbi:MAG: leucine-rich repeat domain-containing protein [Sulfitobacter sp.]|nr:leucine-rich repeat domain-containing protein [Sulfitobacter sp.]
MKDEAQYAEIQAKISYAAQNNMKSLNLSGSRLLELPPDIKKLQNLAHLDLSNNALKKIPPEIGELKN